MIDYNELLSNKEKETHLLEKIEIEKSKLSQLLCDKDLDKKVRVLEAYYCSLQEINRNYSDFINTFGPTETEGL